MPWLPYGIDPQGLLIGVDDAPRGASGLRCPYCAGPLLARKGQHVEHHFAHAEETCAAAGRTASDAPLLPLYDKFTLHLSGAELAELRRLWDLSQTTRLHGYHLDSRAANQLVDDGFLAHNRFVGQTGAYEFTKLGKIPLGQLSLRLFAELHEQRLLEQLRRLETRVEERAGGLAAMVHGCAWQLERQIQAAGEGRVSRAEAQALIAEQEARRAEHEARCAPTLHEARTDVQLYRAQLARVLARQLYFVEIEADGQQMHKIGVTERAIEERLAELPALLRQEGGYRHVQVDLVGTWPHRGHVERYFKYRYQAARVPVGRLTEVFSFADLQPVLRDLRAIPAKQLGDVEQAVLDGDELPSLVQAQQRVDRAAIELQFAAGRLELAIHRVEYAAAHVVATREGMQRAAAAGQHVGRPAGSAEDRARFLAKPSSQEVISLAQAQPDLSLRQLAGRANVAVNTARKVLALWREGAD